MFSDLTKEEIIKQLRNEGRGYDIAKMLDVYEKLLDIPVDLKEVEALRDNVFVGITRFFSLEKMNQNDLMDSFRSFMKIEPYLKKLLYVVDKERYLSLDEQTLFPVLKALDLIKNLKGAISTENPNNYTEDKYFLDHILRAYGLRNNEAHNAEYWSLKNIYECANSVILTSLYAAWKYRAAIEAAYMKADRISATEKINYAYVDGIIDRYKQKQKEGFVFVPIKWEKRSGGKITQHEGLSSIETIIEDIKEEKRLKLLGEAGCGKTTSMEYLEYRDAVTAKKDHTKPIPVKISLIKIANSWFSIEDTICKELDIKNVDCISLLNAGAIKLYLDGVNEISGEQSIKINATKKIEEFLTRYPQVFTVITDRENTHIRVNTDMTTYSFKQMDREEVFEYVKVKSGSNETLRKKVIDYIYSNPDREIRRTPFILNILIEIAMKRDEMPATSIDFIGDYLSMLIEREYKEKKDINAAPGYLDSLLMYFAMDSYTESENSRTGVLRSFNTCKEKLGLSSLDTNECLNLALQLGIMQCTNDICGFIYDDYKEYFLADAFKRGMDKW